MTEITNQVVRNLAQYETIKRKLVQDLVQIRKQANFSQQFMADWLNVDRRKIIELEDCNCTIELLLLYAEKLDYPISIHNDTRRENFF